MIELDDMLTRSAADLADRLEETPSVVGRFLLFEDFLRDRLRRRRPYAPAAIRAIERICESGGRVSAAALRAEIGCSARYLETQLAEHVGLSPKQLSKLVRFSRAIERARAAPVVDWSDIAIDCGYHDQSHFYRDFGRFTGTMPGEFLAQRDPSSQALLVTDAVRIRPICRPHGPSTLPVQGGWACRLTTHRRTTRRQPASCGPRAASSASGSGNSTRAADLSRGAVPSARRWWRATSTPGGRPRCSWSTRRREA